MPNLDDRNKVTTITLAEKQRLVKAALIVEQMVKGNGGRPSQYRPPQYNVAKFKMKEDLSDDDGGGKPAYFWFDETEGDEVTIYPFGINGTVEEDDIIAAFWWDGKWWFLAAEVCPDLDDEEEEE